MREAQTVRDAAQFYGFNRFLDDSHPDDAHAQGAQGGWWSQLSDFPLRIGSGWQHLNSGQPSPRRGGGGVQVCGDQGEHTCDMAIVAHKSMKQTSF